MLEYIALGIALLGTIIASYFDVKTTDIPDWIAIYMTICGIAISATRSIINSNNHFIISSLTVGVIFTALGALQYYTKMWGGADYFILGALGFLIPSLPLPFMPTNAIWPYPVTLFLNIWIVGTIYVLIYSFVLALRSKNFKKFFVQKLRNSKKTIMWGTSLYLFLLLLLSFTGNFINPGVFGSLLYSLFQKTIFYYVGLIVLTIFLQTLQFDIMTKKIRTKQLKEGDVLAKKVTLRKEILPATRLVGLTKEQVKKIQKEKNFVSISFGVPYIPTFAIAIIVTMFFGDLLSMIIPFATL